MHRCVMENLSVDGLVKIIKQDDFLHKSLLPNNFINTISNPATARKAVMMFKDEYFLDFIKEAGLVSPFAPGRAAEAAESLRQALSQ